MPDDPQDRRSLSSSALLERLRRMVEDAERSTDRTEDASPASERGEGPARWQSVLQTAAELVELIDGPDRPAGSESDGPTALAMLRELTSRTDSTRSTLSEFLELYARHGIGDARRPADPGQREVRRAAREIGRATTDAVDRVIREIVERMWTESDGSSAHRHREISDKIDELVDRLVELWFDTDRDRHASR